MKKYLLPLMLVLPLTASAQLADGDGEGGPMGTFLGAAAEFIFGPLLVFLLAVAFIAFAWGVLRYFIADADDDKTKAKSLMLWGILGFVLILILFGAVNLLVEFTGLGDGELGNLPSVPSR